MQIAAKFQQGVSLHLQGRLREAERIYETVLAIDPNHFGALHLIGTIAIQTSRAERAVTFFERAISVDPKICEVFNDLGIALTELKRFDAALAAYDKAIELQPSFAEAYCNRGNTLSELGRVGEAIEMYDKAIDLKKDYADAYINRGAAFRTLDRFIDAEADFGKAIALNPTSAAAYNNRGSALRHLKRFEEALANYDKAIRVKPDYAEAYVNRASVFYELKRYDEALSSYDKAAALKPNLPEAALGRGNVLLELQFYENALAAYDRALASRDDLAEAWLGRGNVYYAKKLYDPALAAYDKARTLRNDLAAAWAGCGNVFTNLKRYDQAYAAYDKALSIDPDLEGAEGLRLHTKMQLCDWANFDADADHLVRSVESRKTTTAPLALSGVSDSSKTLLRCAQIWTEKRHPLSARPLWRGEKYRHDKIRVGYISADFRDHAVSYLMAEVFESHDRKRFETHAFSLLHDEKSAMQKRLKFAFDHFIDTSNKSDKEIAENIRSLNIDILVDLMGYTADSRTSILAMVPAPIQVNYLGFAGTMGAKYIGYIIADPTLVPASQQSHYSEKIIYMPSCFIPHDSKGRNISEKAFVRADFGLPENGFVFCCFNSAYKIHPRVFHSWMTIMKAINDSVLWLSEMPDLAKNNLRKEAQAAGIDPSRLIFAKHVQSSAEHLARHRLADLFLDTLPYNAHTTASDALWAGVPILTQIGEAFAGRVAASLLNAIGLPELVAHAQAEYETMAIELATNRERLAVLKTRLAENILSKPLFDTASFTRHLECAYEAIYERHQKGLPPDHVHVPT